MAFDEFGGLLVSHCQETRRLEGRPVQKLHILRNLRNRPHLINVQGKKGPDRRIAAPPSSPSKIWALHDCGRADGTPEGNVEDTLAMGLEPRERVRLR